MAEKLGWEDGAAVTEEDIIASLKPLGDEYCVGVAEYRGHALIYQTLVGRKICLQSESRSSAQLKTRWLQTH